MKNSLLFVVTFFIFSGCTTAKSANDDYVASIVESRIRKDVRWNRFACSDQIQKTVERLLQANLTVDSSVQVALLNNPIVQSVFEEIGIAYGDLLEAGLLKNPIVEAFFRFPNQSSFCLNTEFAVTQSLVDIFMVPLRKRIASAAFAQTELQVANTILNLAFDVQETFYKLVAGQKINRKLEQLVELTEISYQLAEVQIQAGNINNLTLQTQMNEYLEAKVALAQGQVEIIKLKEHMNVLLGLDSSDTCWSFSHELPTMPLSEFSESCLESIALTHRLDLEAARWYVEKIARTGATKQWWAYTDLVAGFAGEKDPSGLWTQGPAIGASIPIFNYGQADRERLYALYRQSVNQLQALQIIILSELHSANERLLIQRTIVAAYENELLPLQDQILNTSQQYYHVMALSVYKLLDAKKQEIQMQINSTNALKHYWISKIDLDRSLGGYLSASVDLERRNNEDPE